MKALGGVGGCFGEQVFKVCTLLSRKQSLGIGTTMVVEALEGLVDD